MASCATHQPATASGQARSDNSGRSASAATTNREVSRSVSAARAYQETLMSHDKSVTKKMTPQVRARPRVVRRLLPHTASVSKAGPAIASGQKPAGGNAPARAKPAAAAVNRDHQLGRLRGWPAG